MLRILEPCSPCCPAGHVVLAAGSQQRFQTNLPFEGTPRFQAGVDLRGAISRVLLFDDRARIEIRQYVVGTEETSQDLFRQATLCRKRHELRGTAEVLIPQRLITGK